MTYHTDKTLRVPVLIQGRNIVIYDGIMATTTLGSKHGKVVIRAIGLPILLMKAAVHKIFATLMTEEMFRMPGLFQGSDATLRTMNHSEI